MKIIEHYLGFDIRWCGGLSEFTAECGIIIAYTAKTLEGLKAIIKEEEGYNDN